MSDVQNDVEAMLLGADEAWEELAEGSRLTDLSEGTYRMLLTSVVHNPATFTVGKDEAKIEYPGIMFLAKFQGLEGELDGKEYDGDKWFLPDLRRLSQIVPTLPDKGRGAKFGVEQTIRTISQLVRMVLQIDKSRSPADILQVNEVAKSNFIEVTVRITGREVRGNIYKDIAFVAVQVIPNETATRPEEVNA